MNIDIHLAAESIDSTTARRLEAMGFVQDHFGNTRNCAQPAYHASYWPAGVDDVLWNEVKELLTSDQKFRGCLEEEALGREEYFNTPTNLTHRIMIHPFTLDTCRPGEHKACDIHTNIDLSKTSSKALQFMDRFNFASFEREMDGTPRRIYSVTFEKYETGMRVYLALVQLFNRIPDLVGKTKLEKTLRFLTHPSDAVQLPIVREEFAHEWASSLRKEGNYDVST